MQKEQYEKPIIKIVRLDEEAIIYSSAHVCNHVCDYDCDEDTSISSSSE